MGKHIMQHILINTQGFIGERYIADMHSIDFSQAKELNDHSFQQGEKPLFFRPNYQELTTRFNELKHHSFIIILTPEQTKEQELLGTYFKLRSLDHFNIAETVKDHLQIQLDDEEFRDQAIKQPGLRSLYCLLYLDFINYSYLYNYQFNGKQTIGVYTKEHFEKLPLEYTYVHKYMKHEGVDPIFYELLFSEMTGYRFKTTSIYEKILDGNQQFSLYEERVIEELREQHRIIPLEQDGEVTFTFGYLIRD
ncbi:MAG: hypothetical protein ACOCU6_03005 [Nanoarchaeota archaeon]